MLQRQQPRPVLRSKRSGGNVDPGFKQPSSIGEGVKDTLLEVDVYHSAREISGARKNVRQEPQKVGLKDCLSRTSHRSNVKMAQAYIQTPAFLAELRVAHGCLPFEDGSLEAPPLDGSNKSLASKGTTT